MAEEMNNVPVSEGEENVGSVLEVRRNKLFELQASGNDPYMEVKYEVNAYAADIKNNFEAMEGKTVSMAGRIMSRRDMGKANFFDIADSTGRIQVYIKLDDVGEEMFSTYKKWDIGDIVGLVGMVFKSRRGELSLHTETVKLLSKSLRPPARKVPRSQGPGSQIPPEIC